MKEHPWHWQPLPIFLVGMTALAIVAIAVSIGGDATWVNIVLTPAAVVTGLVQYRLITIAMGRR